MRKVRSVHEYIYQQTTEQQSNLRKKLVLFGGQQALDRYDEKQKSNPPPSNSSSLGQLTSEKMTHELMLNPSFRLEYHAEEQDENNDSWCDAAYERNRDSLMFMRIVCTFPDSFWSTTLHTELQQLLDALTHSGEQQSEIKQQSKFNSQSTNVLNKVLREICTSMENIIAKNPEADDERQIICDLTNPERISSHLMHLLANPCPSNRIAQFMQTSLHLLNSILQCIQRTREKVFPAKNALKQTSKVSKDHQLNLDAAWTGIQVEFANFNEQRQLCTTDISSSSHVALLLSNALRHVTKAIYAFRTDCANFKLLIASHEIRSSGLQFERTHIADRIESGKLTLQVTKAWIRQLSSTSANFIEAINKSIVELVTSSAAHNTHNNGLLDIKLLPETLAYLNELHLQSLNAYFHMGVMRMIMLTTLSTHIPPALLDSVNELILQDSRKKSMLPKPFHCINARRKTIDCIFQRFPIPIELKPVMEQNMLSNASPVYQTTAKVFLDIWFRVVNNSPRHDVSMHQKPIQTILQLTEKHAMHLKRIADLNKNVFLDTYRMLQSVNEDDKAVQQDAKRRKVSAES